MRSGRGGAGSYDEEDVVKTKKAAKARKVTLPHNIDRQDFMWDCETLARAVDRAPCGRGPDDVQAMEMLADQLRNPAVETIIDSLDCVLGMDDDRPILSDDERATVRHLLYAIKHLTECELAALCSAA
jgi:hypothetical protein